MKQGERGGHCIRIETLVIVYLPTAKLSQSGFREVYRACANVNGLFLRGTRWTATALSRNLGIGCPLGGCWHRGRLGNFLFSSFFGCFSRLNAVQHMGDDQDSFPDIHWNGLREMLESFGIDFDFAHLYASCWLVMDSCGRKQHWLASLEMSSEI